MCPCSVRVVEVVTQVLGSATTIISNPLWVIQTAQATHTLHAKPVASTSRPVKKLGFVDTINSIIAKDGIGAFMRGIGPALILVINPVLQYTVFEQLKNVLIARRSAKIQASGAVATVAVLTNLDFFYLGMISKLGESTNSFMMSS